MTQAVSWCIDFAYVEDGCLVLFGWLVEPSCGLRGVLLPLPGHDLDLGPHLIRTSRPDVPAPPAHPSPGLLIAVEIGTALADGSRLELLAVLADGSTQQIEFTPSNDRARFRHFARANHFALLRLLARLPAPQRVRLDPLLALARLPPAALPKPEALTIALLCRPIPSLLLALGDRTGASPRVGPIRVRIDEAAARTRLHKLPGSAERFILAVKLAPGHTDGTLHIIPPGGGSAHAFSLPIAALPCGIAAFDDGLTGLDPEAQLRLLEILAEHIKPGTADEAAWRPLWAARAEALPLRLDHPARRLVLDHACRVGDHGLLLSGWLHAAPGPAPRITLRTAAGPAFDLSAAAVATARLDVWHALTAEGALLETDELGFTVFARVALPDPRGILLTLTTADGTQDRMRIVPTDLPADPLAAIRALLADLAPGHRQLRPLLDQHLGPAVELLWSGRPRPTRPPSILQFGTPAAATPDASLVVPVYGRADFIEFQLAEFANDPAMRGQDLIYVIDDPTLYDPVRAAAPDLAACYGVPFRLVYAGRTGGYAEATNLGATLARAPTLLLLNSDVLPIAPGWLGALITAHRRHEAGAVGPRLLYPDGSLQHDGMRFAKLAAWDGLWVNEHPGKGLPPSEDRGARPVAALTGACLLLATSLFRALGGLSDDYILGDFEDSDLCLRMRRLGLLPVLVPEIALYHLERQSQGRIAPQSWRTNLTLYNCWRHHRLWDRAITALDQPA